MNYLKPTGVYTALVTPFTADGAEVDWSGLRQNIAFQLQEGVSGLLAVGTTGESPTLSWTEHEQVIERAILYAAKTVPVMAGVGSNTTREALAAAVHARKMGADLGLLVDCYYNGPSSLELREHYYAAVCRAVPDFPIVPYIIPGRTGCALAPEDLALLAVRQPQVVGVKEATGDLERMKRTRELCGPDFALLSGDDDLTLAMMLDPGIKAVGVISVMSNLVPGEVSRLVKAAAAGDAAGARAIAEKLAPLFRLVSCKATRKEKLPGGRTVEVVDKFRNPLPLKTMMAGLGLPAGPCRPPLGKMTRAGVETCRRALAEILARHPEVLEPISRHYNLDVGGHIADHRVWEALSAS